MIDIDVDERRINMDVTDTELAARREAWARPEDKFERGYGWMFARHITQANEGCDLDFLETSFGTRPPEPDIL